MISVMCGIFAYIGKRKDAPQLILDGLKTLEYRGYDSWGIVANPSSQFTVHSSLLVVQKQIGKIGNSTLNHELSTMNSGLAIGHTRWATHGGVTVANAHPHLDCKKRLAIVHNGIVENYESLKNDLVKSKHLFLSDTDTEVIAHLIEDYLGKNSLQDAVLKTFNALKGLSAIVVLDSQTNTLIAVKNGSPLIIGIGKDEFFIASDLSAITLHTKDVVFLKDNEMAVIKDTLTLFSLPKGNKITPKVEKITWKTAEVKLGSHKHFMIKEIFDQPTVIENILHEYASEIENLAKTIQKFQHVYFIAAGTAYNATLAAVYLLSQGGIHTEAKVASEFESLMPFMDKNTLIIALSQSGETIDVIEPLSHAQKKGATVAALVNVLGSTIYRMADIKILLGAGPEMAVASTKAYIAKLAILLLVAYQLAGKEKQIQSSAEEAVTEIQEMIQPEFLSKIKDLVKKLAPAKNIYVIGRGVSYSSALEAALKIKEVSYTHTEGLAGGELKHGTIALIEKGTPCIVFAPMDSTYNSILSNAIEIQSRGGFIIGVSPKNSHAFDYWIPVKDLGDASLLTQIVPLQLLAYYLALAKGIKDPDKPRNLAKSVTVK